MHTSNRSINQSIIIISDVFVTPSESFIVQLLDLLHRESLITRRLAAVLQSPIGAPNITAPFSERPVLVLPPGPSLGYIAMTVLCLVGHEILETIVETEIFLLQSPLEPDGLEALDVLLR